MNEDEPIFVLKDGKRLGPFSMDGLLEEIERGGVNYEDPCLRAGRSECERVREVLDWDESGHSPDSPPGFESPEENPDPLRDPEDDADDFALEEEIEEFLEEASEPGPPSDPNAVLYAGHPSFLSFPRSLGVIALSIGAGLYFRDSSPWVFFVGLVIALFAVSWILLERSTRLYLITPRRVEIVTGLIAKSSNEVRIEDIRTINVQKSGLTGILGVGCVEFASSGGSTVEVSFRNVWAANRIKALVRRLQDA